MAAQRTSLERFPQPTDRGEALGAWAGGSDGEKGETGAKGEKRGMVCQVDGEPRRQAGKARHAGWLDWLIWSLWAFSFLWLNEQDRQDRPAHPIDFSRIVANDEPTSNP